MNKYNNPLFVTSKQDAFTHNKAYKLIYYYYKYTRI
jgi:hypothetical protein